MLRIDIAGSRDVQRVIHVNSAVHDICSDPTLHDGDVRRCADTGAGQAYTQCTAVGTHVDVVGSSNCDGTGLLAAAANGRAIQISFGGVAHHIHRGHAGPAGNQPPCATDGEVPKVGDRKSVV